MPPTRNPLPIAALVLCGSAIPLCGLAVPAARAQQQQPAPTRVKARSIYDHPLLQKKVSLSLKDADINQAVKELARSAGVSLVVERAWTPATRPVTLELKDAHVGDVLDLLGRMYGYRWRRKGEVFLLTLAPTQRDTENEPGENLKAFFTSVLTPEQREQAQARGFLLGKDLTPGQKGVLWGFFQDLLLASQSRGLEVGRVDFSFADGNLESMRISSTEGDGEDQKDQKKP